MYFFFKKVKPNQCHRLLFKNFANRRKYKFQSHEVEKEKKSLFIPFLFYKSLKSFFFLNQNKMGGLRHGEKGW